MARPSLRAYASTVARARAKRARVVGTAVDGDRRKVGSAADAAVRLSKMGKVSGCSQDPSEDPQTHIGALPLLVTRTVRTATTPSMGTPWLIWLVVTSA